VGGLNESVRKESVDFLFFIFFFFFHLKRSRKESLLVSGPNTQPKAASDIAFCILLGLVHIIWGVFSLQLGNFHVVVL